MSHQASQPEPSKHRPTLPVEQPSFYESKFFLTSLFLISALSTLTLFDLPLIHSFAKAQLQTHSYPVAFTEQ